MKHNWERQEKSTPLEKWEYSSWGGISEKSHCETGVYIFDENVNWLNEFDGTKKFNKDGLEISVCSYYLHTTATEDIVEYGKELLGNFTFKEIEDIFTSLIARSEKIRSVSFSGHFITVNCKIDGKDHTHQVYGLDELKSIVERRKYYIIL